MNRNRPEVITQLYRDLASDLVRVAQRFKNPKITLIVRNPDRPDGEADVLMTDDDVELAIAAIRQRQASTTGTLIQGKVPHA